MNLVELHSHGLAKQLATVCSVGGETFKTEFTSPRIGSKFSQRPPFEVNRTFTEALISAGTGYSALQNFGSETGISIMSHTSWDKHHHPFLRGALKVGPRTVMSRFTL